MSFQTKDGKVFHSRGAAERYVSSLRDDDGKPAPGGRSWEHDTNQHGPAVSSRIEPAGPGRWRLTAKHADGYVHTSVHPETLAAHHAQAVVLGIQGPIPGEQTQDKAKAHPVGPHEANRLAVEDRRYAPEEGEER